MSWVDTSMLDPNSALGDLPLGAPSNDNGPADLPATGPSSISNLPSALPGFLNSGALDNGSPSGLSLPVDLPFGSTGSNLIADITKLVGGVYAGENQLAATRAAQNIASSQARQAQAQQATVTKEFTYAALFGVGILALTALKRK